MVRSRGSPPLAAPVCLLLLAALGCAAAPAFQLPTANRALFEPDSGDRFFVGTAGRSWTSGCFGCVRSEGWQMHEGLDIRSIARDKRGEPTDPVLATADGTVAYINSRSSLSTYGIYIVLQHRVDGIEIYSLYAHMRQVQPGLKVGQPVRAGDPVGVMGRTANTAQAISKDRAHVHFELNLLVNERFPAWYKKTFPGQRNDHRQWNGQNMLGLDPRAVLLAVQQEGEKFNLLKFVRSQTELCRVVVHQADFPWIRRYPALVRRNPAAEKEGVAGYELVLNYNGVPFEVIPRAASEIKGRARYQLLSVNEPEYRRNPCRRLVTLRGGRWELATRGTQLLDLLTH